MISGAFIEVTCDGDGCADTEQFPLTSIARNGWDGRNLEGGLDDAGWQTVDGKHFCPTCVEEKNTKH